MKRKWDGLGATAAPRTDHPSPTRALARRMSGRAAPPRKSRNGAVPSQARGRLNGRASRAGGTREALEKLSVAMMYNRRPYHERGWCVEEDGVTRVVLAHVAAAKKEKSR